MVENFSGIISTKADMPVMSKNGDIYNHFFCTNWLVDQATLCIQAIDPADEFVYMIIPFYSVSGIAICIAITDEMPVYNIQFPEHAPETTTTGTYPTIEE